MRKPTICMGENKDADQLRGNREADQRLCFRYTDSTFPPLLIPKFSRFWVSSVTVQAGLCWTWLETQIVGFVMHRLIFKSLDFLMSCPVVDNLAKFSLKGTLVRPPSLAPEDLAM